VEAAVRAPVRTIDYIDVQIGMSKPSQKHLLNLPKSLPSRRVTNPKHHPNSKSPEPPNADELFNKSIVDKHGVRWAKDADGITHRFSKQSNGESHWNGSTFGPKGIRPDDIPNDIRNALP
jgi:hypothetical protein